MTRTDPNPTAAPTRPWQDTTLPLSARVDRLLADVRFRVHADRTAYTNRDLVRVVEPGEIAVLAGTSAADLPLSATVTLTGPLRTVGPDRRLDTPVQLVPLGPGATGRDSGA